GSVTSQASAATAASEPERAIAALAVSSVSAFRARIATFAPDSAKRIAVASPSPLLPPVMRAVRPSSRISIARLLPPVGEAARALEREAEVTAERLDRGTMVRIGIAVLGPHDDDAKGRVLLAAGRQHRRRERRPLGVPQRQKEGHRPLDVRLETDLLLDER